MEILRITILRHGEPDFEWERSVRGGELRRLKKAYDAAGIVGNPPATTRFLVEQHSFVVCSDLSRSLRSAEAIGVQAVHLSDPLFREMDIPYFDNISLKLPLKLWAVVLRGLWFLGFSKNAESHVVAKNRARQVSEKLIELATEHHSVLFVGHGFLNHYIAKELLTRSWAGPSSPGKKYWEYGTYEYQET